MNSINDFSPNDTQGGQRYFMAHWSLVHWLLFVSQFEVEEEEVDVSEFLDCGTPAFGRRAGSTCPGPRRGSRRARGSPPRGT